MHLFAITFPFDLPAATLFYVTVYVLVFSLHQVLMHYVLGGCFYLSWSAARKGPEDELSLVVRDWLPFALSAAITAGVAPLLFIQVLYATPFYTANLLLFWRWMLILPLLIAGFYGLYVIKSDAWQRWPRAARLSLVAAVTMAFLFVGICWSMNHIVSNSGEKWGAIYTDGLSALSTDAFTRLLLRFSVWATAALASWAVLIQWQLAARRAPAAAVPRVLAAVGAVAATAAGAALLFNSEAATDASMKPIMPWMGIAIAGLVAQLWSWWRDSPWLLRGGWLAWVLAGSVLREWLRLQSINVERFQPRHAEAWQVGGLGVFLAAVLVCGAVAIYCLRMVQTPPN